MTALSIPAHYNGPPGTGHGGYCAGRFAACVAGSPDHTVTLRLPPPLESVLDVAVDDDGAARILLGEALVAEVRGTALDLAALRLPVAPGLAEAEAGAEQSAFRTGTVDHPFPTCFGCGPDRTPEDGLRLWPGLVPDGRTAACVWEPQPWAYDSGSGLVPEELVWAALDCPGALGAMEQMGLTLSDETWLLGRMTATLARPVPGNEPLVVCGWLASREGRKRDVGSAIFDASGEMLAASAATWITVG